MNYCTIQIIVKYKSVMQTINMYSCISCIKPALALLHNSTDPFFLFLSVLPLEINNHVGILCHKTYKVFMV